MKGYLLLEDGTTYEGSLFGSQNPACGELVFNTSMTGYQEILTDPSYWRQNVVLTFPEIGIYGTCPDWSESELGHASGMIVRNFTESTAHRLSTSSFGELLKEKQIPVLSGLDTRALTIKIREKGPQKSLIASADLSKDRAIEIMKATPSMEGANLVPDVSCSKMLIHGTGKWNVGLIDYGVKKSIIRQLVSRDCTVYQFPWDTPFKSLNQINLHGFLLSNGPGDPAAVPGVRETIKSCHNLLPTMGICLGYQLLALSLGASTYKLPFGHRGGNHPVKDLLYNRVMITAQNHGFAVDPDSFSAEQVSLTHTSLFDGSLEGFQLNEFPAFGVQFHPEAGPGPSDALKLFDQFIKSMEEFHA